MSDSAVVGIKGLRFSYPPARGHSHSAFELRLDDWDVRAGERVAMHGPSGCGKSTLLNLVAGTLRPTTGTIHVAGSELGALDEARIRAHRIRNLGFVFQDFPLVNYLDVEENVLLPFRLNPALRLDSPARQRANELLADLGLGDRAASDTAELSAGERQRVAIARALVTDPSLLLADEPTAGLDPEQSVRVVELLEAACENHGLTMLMVTHDPALLARFDRVLAVGELRFEDSSR